MSKTGCALVIALLAPVLAETARGQTCASCHGDRAAVDRLAPDTAARRRLWVDPAVYGASVHGRAALPCTTCHTGVKGYPHGDVAPADCARCHENAARDWAASIHGRPHPLTGTAPASCADCHGAHDIRALRDPESSVYRRNQYRTCAVCHSDGQKMARFGQKKVERVESYLESAHGIAVLEKGLAVAPTCTGCHGREGAHPHRIEPVRSPASPMNRANVVETCGRCHAGIANEYYAGIHGRDYREGNPDVPTCIDCHGEHGVQPVGSPTSSVYPTHIAQTCSACHDREQLNDRYGLPTARRSTYLGSFHGIALVAGQLTVANCESCHGAHKILPSSDPQSSIHPANLVETCGRCHPGIGPRVAEGKIHVVSVREDINLLAYGVQWFYYLLIAGIVTFAAAMIFLDQYRHRRVDPRRGRRGYG